MRRNNHRSTSTCCHHWFGSVLLFALFLTGSAHGARVEIIDRETGTMLPVFEHKGRSYIVGEPGSEYEIRVRSAHGQRLLAVASVDGVNVITGETAAASQSGYVLDPYGFVRIEGWRKNVSHTAAFFFTKLRNSYAARTGRPDNVGVIGVALFSELTPCCQAHELSKSEDRASNGASAKAAPAQRSRTLEADGRLGTGHGRSEYSAASYTSFRRASSRPDETVTFYYDSRRNLVAQGIIPAHEKYAGQMPQPFPNSFVPDP